MSITTSTTYWLVWLWESGWCRDEDYFPSRYDLEIEGSLSRDAAIFAAFEMIFPQGKIMATPRGGEKGAYFVAFYGGGATNDCGLVTVVGRYCLLKAKGKQQSFAYLKAVNGSYPDWVEKVTAKKQKKVVDSPSPPRYDNLRLPIGCLNCGTTVDEQGECPLCGEKVNRAAFKI